ncbi:putative N-acetyl-LL-diaminopimelate aminotransferase [Halomonadaceae bacterium LMG 33818]|uniref:pyridoxal phosphate-dependent aminotransferase n=1 Tax=Cernens ardua TaxID=3402176 RepID=UPI003EDC6F68
MSSHQNVPEASPIIKSLSGSMIREVADAAMGQDNVLPFWFGETDRATPDFIRQAAVAGLHEGETFYSQNLGRPYLREAISRYLERQHKVDIPAHRIAAVSSGLMGLKLASELLLAPGDKVVAITPLWPNLTEIPKIRQAQVERVSLVIQDNTWTLDLDQLLNTLTPDTRALIINSPNNPTGWTIDEKSLIKVLEHCRQRGIWIISDDVYSRLVYDTHQKAAPSFLEHAQPNDLIISVNSFSKAWCMTGWRVGWMVVPENLIKDLEKLIEYNFSCIFEPIQKAAVAALEHGEESVNALRQRLVDSRRLLETQMKSLPSVEIPNAQGAMYLFFKIQGFEDSMQLAKNLVKEVGLGLAPGVAFGEEGEGWLRWCHAVSDDDTLLEGIARLKQFIAHQ